MAALAGSSRSAKVPAPRLSASVLVRTRATRSPEGAAGLIWCCQPLGRWRHRSRVFPLVVVRMRAVRRRDVCCHRLAGRAAYPRRRPASMSRRTTVCSARANNARSAPWRWRSAQSAQQTGGRLRRRHGFERALLDGQSRGQVQQVLRQRHGFAVGRCDGRPNRLARVDECRCGSGDARRRLHLTRGGRKVEARASARAGGALRLSSFTDAHHQRVDIASRRNRNAAPMEAQPRSHQLHLIRAGNGHEVVDVELAHRRVVGTGESVQDERAVGPAPSRPPGDGGRRDRSRGTIESWERPDLRDRFSLARRGRAPSSRSRPTN